MLALVFSLLVVYSDVFMVTVPVIATVAAA